MFSQMMNAELSIQISEAEIGPLVPRVHPPLRLTHYFQERMNSFAFSRFVRLGLTWVQGRKYVMCE